MPTLDYADGSESKVYIWGLGWLHRKPALSTQFGLNIYHHSSLLSFCILVDATGHAALARKDDSPSVRSYIWLPFSKHPIAFKKRVHLIRSQSGSSLIQKNPYALNKKPCSEFSYSLLFNHLPVRDHVFEGDDDCARRLMMATEWFDSHGVWVFGLPDEPFAFPAVIAPQFTHDVPPSRRMDP